MKDRGTSKVGTPCLAMIVPRVHAVGRACEPTDRPLKPAAVADSRAAVKTAWETLSASGPFAPPATDVASGCWEACGVVR